MSINFLVSLFLLASSRLCRATRVDDICARGSTRRVFLGLGESGVLTALDVAPGRSANGSLRGSCRLDVVTCPSCIVSLGFRFMNLSCHCGTGLNLFLHNPCRCDYVWISEPPYEDSSGTAFCRVVPGEDVHGKGLEYRSKTRTVRIWLFYSKAHAHAFTLDYRSEPNRHFFFGTSRQPQELNFSAGSISSPFFPAAYPRDSAAEYVLTCVRRSDGPPADDDRCRVRLIFTDFRLASASVLEFYEGNRRVGVAGGTSFRPPAIVSRTNSLAIRFYASGQSGVGFKAVFSFISESIAEKIGKPRTDCGGYVDDFGGTITMTKMVESETKLFDCIWIIRPLKNLSGVKSHQYLKVITFRGFAGDAELEIRQGLNSESPTLEVLRHPASQNFQEHVIPFRSGFYVSLRAFFGPASRFAVAYALFTQQKCVFLPSFVCRNFRCISGKLTCDGFDHCGDGSDEPAVCRRGRGSESGVGEGGVGGVDGGDGEEGLRAPNYYFPKMDEYAVAKTASTVFVLSLAALIFLVSSLAFALHLIESKARHERNLRDELQSAANFQDGLSDEVSLEDVVVDDPPSYEAPPNYEEVVKSLPEKNASGEPRSNSEKETVIEEKSLQFLSPPAKERRKQQALLRATRRVQTVEDACVFRHPSVIFRGGR